MNESKECSKCKCIKPLDSFYKHSRMADGHLNTCKTCHKADVQKHRDDNIEKIRAYDRDRGKHPHRIKSSVEHTKNWRLEDRRRAKAHKAVSRALTKGTLQKESCCRCQAQKAVAHHEDYDFPLTVMWLCQPCHKQRHKEILQCQQFQF